MATITIQADFNEDTGESVADYVAYMARQIREGCRSGHVDANRNWDSTGLES